MLKPSRSTDIKAQVGLRLRAARLIHALDQAPFACAFGVSPSALGNWERGEKLADVLAMVRMAERFPITLEWIYAGQLRHMDFDVQQRLLMKAAEIGAVVGGSVAQWPMQAHERGAASAPKAPTHSGGGLHEAQERLKDKTTLRGF
jgi:transcriptional regulator with XRE-family HTH domain